MVGDHGARPAACPDDADAAGPFDSSRRDRLSASTWPAFLTIDAVADAGFWAGGGGWGINGVATISVSGYLRRCPTASTLVISMPAPTSSLSRSSTVLTSS